MDFADIIVDGVRLADTDFSKFTRLCQLSAWEKLAKAAARAEYGDDMDKLWAFGDFRHELSDATRDRLIDESREREQHCAARNLDLKVIKTYPEEWTAEDIAANPDSCAIGKNDGRSPNEIVWGDFVCAIEMTNYEFAAYGILGDEELDRQGIDTLYDMFGTEFANRFYRRKKQLIALSELEEAYKERDTLNERITKLEEEAKG